MNVAPCGYFVTFYENKCLALFFGSLCVKFACEPMGFLQVVQSPKPQKCFTAEQISDHKKYKKSTLLKKVTLRQQNSFSFSLCPECFT